MARINSSTASPLPIQTQTPDPAAMQAESRSAGMTAASPAAPEPATKGAPSATAISRERHRLERLLQAAGRRETDGSGYTSGSADRTGSTSAPSTSSLVQEYAGSGGDSAVSRMPSLRTTSKQREQIPKTLAEQLPDAVMQGHDAAIEALKALLEGTPGENPHGATNINAADQCLSVPAASLAEIIKKFIPLAAGLDHASLERILIALARSLPYEKHEGSLAAMRAFGDALDQHGGRLDNAARERLLGTFDARTKPRKTSSPYLRVLARHASPVSTEFSSERRSVRAKLKPPSENLKQPLKGSVASFNTSSAAMRR